MMSENAHDAEVGSRLRSWVTRSVDEFKPPIEVGFKAGLCIAIADRYGYPGAYQWVERENVMLLRAASVNDIRYSFEFYKYFRMTIQLWPRLNKRAGRSWARIGVLDNAISVITLLVSSYMNIYRYH
ncbi:hypothetical protein H0G86_005542 [Trichoderma simmonsii]|uniref:Uncharacterized protein n=1 Tax=Trichoderma simmonsii TaxID=1491479 RepID=A0A8G0LEU2_9HYPO|nr:hypothetical protein H0G86_005542 [Trichoderma simmonsii]